MNSHTRFGFGYGRRKPCNSRWKPPGWEGRQKNAAKVATLRVQPPTHTGNDQEGQESGDQKHIQVNVFLIAVNFIERVKKMKSIKDYDNKIELYQKKLQELNSERQEICEQIEREYRTKERQHKIQREILLMDNDTLIRQREAMIEWLKRKWTLSNGKTVVLWDLFIRSYPEYDYLGDDMESGN